MASSPERNIWMACQECYFLAQCSNGVYLPILISPLWRRLLGKERA